MYNLNHNYNFKLPTTIEYGSGSISRLEQMLSRLNYNKIMIVTDPGIIKAGLVNRVTDILEKLNIKYIIFDNVEANPKDYNVEMGAELAQNFQAEAFIAVGGGSPMDCAKAIGVLSSHHDTRIKNYKGKEAVTNRIPPLIAIPTTAGTGSEITFSAVITDTDNNYKMTIKSPLMAPEVALLDPELTVTMPAEVTASTGLDALTHAIEAYTVRPATTISNAAALYAVELITANLRKAFRKSTNIEARAGMLTGSLLAGMAFSQSDVGSVHCMAEALGSIYDAPHGVCNSILLPYVMEYNMDYCQEKYKRIAEIMVNAGSNTSKIDKKYKKDNITAATAVRMVKILSKDVELPSFKSLKVKKEDLPLLAEMAADNISTESNPRPMNIDDYLQVFSNALEDE